MENKTYSNFLHIVNTDKWKELKQKSIHYCTMLEYLDRSEPKEKIIKDLQVLCFAINNTLCETIDYLQLKENLNILNSKKEKIYIYSKDLNETLHKCINELKTFGTTELVDYDKLYFDYLELTPKANKETSIYAYEIEKEFKEFIKIKAVEQGEDEAKKDKTQEKWFIIGVKLATGELQQLYNKHKSYPKVAETFGNKKEFLQIVKCTLANYTDINNIRKNIYERPEQMRFIYDYCIKEDIKMTDSFITKYNALPLD